MLMLPAFIVSDHLKDEFIHEEYKSSDWIKFTIALYALFITSVCVCLGSSNLIMSKLSQALLTYSQILFLTFIRAVEILID